MQGTPSPLPCVSALVRVNEKKKNKKIERNREAERGCQCLMLFVSIQGKLTLCVDRTGYHLLGFCCPPQGFGSGGFEPSSLLSHDSSTLDPLFSQLLSVNVKAPSLCQICSDSCGTASFELCRTPLTLPGLQVSSFNGSWGQETV